MVMIIQPKKRDVSDWADDTQAIIAALEGCQQGLGGIFPNGTAAMYVHPDDGQAYAARRARLDRIAAQLKDGTLSLSD